MEKIAPFEEHLLAKKANEELRAKKAQKQKISNQEVKAFAISQAIEKSRQESKKAKESKQKGFFANKKFLSFSLSFFVAIFGVGYLTYTNLPEISSWISEIQSGMTVETPSYIADGYSPKGLAYFDGKNVNFEYKKNNSNYKIQQAQSDWDSSALLQNYVNQKWSEDYSTTYSNGLTIYSNHRGESVWVNNGKLYKVEASDKISDDENRKNETLIKAKKLDLSAFYFVDFILRKKTEIILDLNERNENSFCAESNWIYSCWKCSKRAISIFNRQTNWRRFYFAN